MSFEPKIVGFLCNWCSYAGADLAGVSRLKSRSGRSFTTEVCSQRLYHSHDVQWWAESILYSESPRSRG